MSEWFESSITLTEMKWNEEGIMIIMMPLAWIEKINESRLISWENC